MTRDEIMALDGDALRLAVAQALGYAKIREIDGDVMWGRLIRQIGGFTEYEQVQIRDWPHDKLAAIDLLDSMTYPGEDTRVEYIIIKETCGHLDNIDPLPAPYYEVEIFGRNPVHGDDYEATGDTLALAATRAWLMRESSL